MRYPRVPSPARALLAQAALLVMGASAIAACDLGLDESQIGEGASGPTGSGGQGATSSASGGGQGGAGTSTGGGGGAGAGTASTCWGADPTVWNTISPVDLGLLQGGDPENLAISGDALTLYYGALSGAERRPWVATRDDRGLPFTGGQLLASWPGTQSYADPFASQGDKEVILSAGGDLMLTERSGNNWVSPASAGAQVNTASQESNATANEEGTSVLFERYDGPAHVVFGATSRLYEGRRSGSAAPGDPITTPALVSLPPIQDTDMAVCPTLSPDGLHLFFGSSYPVAVVDAATAANSITIWYVTRPTVDGPWGEPVQIPQLSGPIQTCPTAVSDDGCELWIAQFSLDGSAPHAALVAQRQPTP